VAHATVQCTANHCTFDARTSTDEDAPTLTYAWNFGNGRTATGSVPSMYYTAAGTYTVTLTATDQYGLTNATTLSVPITTPAGNHAPTAVLNPPACNGAVCNFSAVGSSDPDVGDAITYLWNFGDGSPVVTSSATSHTFPGVGPYTVSLTVTDGWGASTTVTRSAP
jgi:PKD repeat protein